MLLQALRRVGFACLTLMLLTGLVFAQSDNASISGIVKDPTGASVANARVTIRNEGTGFERIVNSNESGFYTVTNLPPGYYTVIVEMAGFKSSTKTRNKLEAALPLQVNAELAVGALSESVTVEANVAQLNTESATVGKTVEQVQIQNLTLNGRNPMFLAMLKPGVRRGSALSGFSYGLDSGGLTINGGRSQDSLITFDGAVGIRTRANGTAIGTADLDTVQEVQVLTANYSAEYGRSSAGQIRMVTKSGTKNFHGTFYEYFRNSAIDANSWSRNRVDSTNFVAPLKFNQFGYNINGPVTIPGAFNKSREKLFFLWSQEWVRRRYEDTLNQRVPSLAMRNGDFSELLGPNIFYNAPRAINDPADGSAVSRKHHSAEPAESERYRVPEGVITPQRQLRRQQLAQGSSRSGRISARTTLPSTTIPPKITSSVSVPRFMSTRHWIRTAAASIMRSLTGRVRIARPV